METRLSRRTFLKAGLAGALVLGLAGGLYRLSRKEPAPRALVFDADLRSMLGAVVPVVLQDAVERRPETIAAAIDRVQQAVSGLPLATQKEISDLFGLMLLAPGRRFLAGIPTEWAQARPEDVAAFLQAWRTHRFGLLQTAYHALHDLITGAWYADETSWAAIGYPGPMKELSGT